MDEDLLWIKTIYVCKRCGRDVIETPSESVELHYCVPKGVE